MSTFLFFLGGGRGFYLRSVAPSAPKPPPTPLHVRGGDTALLAQSVANLNLTFSGYGSRQVKFEVKFANLTSNLNVKVKAKYFEMDLNVAQKF